MPGTSPDADPASQATARPPRRRGALAPSQRVGAQKLFKPLPDRRAAAGVRGTELGGGAWKGTGLAANLRGAAPRATTALTSRGGPWAAGRPPQAHLCISHLSGGAPAHCTPYERHLLSFWPLATTRRGITKGHDAAFTAIIRLITRHIIYGVACRAARDSRALVQIPARDAVDTTRRS